MYLIVFVQICINDHNHNKCICGSKLGIPKLDGLLLAAKYDQRGEANWLEMWLVMTCQCNQLALPGLRILPGTHGPMCTDSHTIRRFLCLHWSAMIHDSAHLRKELRWLTPLHWLHRLYIHYWQKAQLRNVTEKFKMHCTVLAEAKQRKPTDQWQTVADNGLHAIAIGLIQQGWDHLQSRTSSSLDDGNSFKQLLCATRSHIMQCSQGDYANYANLILQSSKNLKRTKAKGRGHFQSQNWKRTSELSLVKHVCKSLDLRATMKTIEWVASWLLELRSTELVFVWRSLFQSSRCPAPLLEPHLWLPG